MIFRDAPRPTPTPTTFESWVGHEGQSFAVDLMVDSRLGHVGLEVGRYPRVVEVVLGCGVAPTESKADVEAGVAMKWPSLSVKLDSRQNRSSHVQINPPHGMKPLLPISLSLRLKTRALA